VTAAYEVNDLQAIAVTEDRVLPFIAGDDFEV